MTLVAARDLSPLGIRVVHHRARHHQHPGLRQGRRPARAVLGPAGAVPQAHGPVDRVRAAGAEHHRERLPQRRDHPPRRSAALPAEVTAVARRQGRLRRRCQSRHRRDDRRSARRAQGAAVAVAARSEQRGQAARHHRFCRRRASRRRAGAHWRCRATSPARSRWTPRSQPTVAEFGGIDILVANAGVLWLGPIESTPLKRWQLCLDVNLTGVFLVTKAVIPHVRARGGGSLIAITTTGVTMIDHGANAYWVSKAGAERLYLGLAADLKPDNIAVNCLSPSRVVLTEGWQAGGGWLSRFHPRWSSRPKRWATRRCCWRARMPTASPAPSSAPKPSPSNRASHFPLPRACVSAGDTPVFPQHARSHPNGRT